MIVLGFVCREKVRLGCGPVIGVNAAGEFSEIRLAGECEVRVRFPHLERNGVTETKDSAIVCAEIRVVSIGRTRTDDTSQAVVMTVYVADPTAFPRSQNIVARQRLSDRFLPFPVE